MGRNTTNSSASPPNLFGKLLREKRDAAGLTRIILAQRVQMDPSYLYRIETGNRVPSLELVLLLAEALELDADTRHAWLSAAGFTPSDIPLLRGPIRTRGGVRMQGSASSQLSGREAGDRGLPAGWLDVVGLQVPVISQLIHLVDKAGINERHTITSAISKGFVRLIEQLQSPIRTAVIPAAGAKRDRSVLAHHAIQRLLLRAIVESASCGISQIIVVLEPGMSEPLVGPLQEALSLCIVPPIRLECIEQPQPRGLGEAVLLAEAMVGDEAFAVLLPDDVIREHARRFSVLDLRRMMDAYTSLKDSSLIAVTEVHRSKMTRCGVARIESKEEMPGIKRVGQLIEKPDSAEAISRSPAAQGIVGRYLLHPCVFDELRKFRRQQRKVIHLTEALEKLRQEGQSIYAYEVESARRQDVGEWMSEAEELIGSRNLGSPPRIR